MSLPDAPPRAPTKPRKRLREFSPIDDRIPECAAPHSYQAIAAFSEEAGMKRDELLQSAAWFEKKAKDCRLEALKQPWLCPAEIAQQRLASAKGRKQMLFNAVIQEMDETVKRWKQDNPSP